MTTTHASQHVAPLQSRLPASAGAATESFHHDVPVFDAHVISRLVQSIRNTLRFAFDLGRSEELKRVRDRHKTVNSESVEGGGHE